MNRITIGIHADSKASHLTETLEFLLASTSPEHSIVLLGDGLEKFPSTKTRLASISLSSTPEPLGAPACLNRLLKERKADIYVFLESGSFVGANWLERLVSALEADPRNGLAGPSTNRSWNEQQIFPHAEGTVADIARTAEEAARRFGNNTRTLEPLYSLADFCYVVRREVFESIGPADERFGLGPCWEMDYNIRAARAGWRGVWAGAVYVWRASVTEERGRNEERLFEANKRLYQDRFCGARCRGEKEDYRAHCRGDACSNFAPGEFQHCWHLSAEKVSIDPLKPLKSGLPLVSCIMPTFNRGLYVSRAIQNFQRQDYPNLELLIVDDGTEPVEKMVPPDPRIRYIRMDQKTVLGEKRNFACERGRGEFIMHWDDDDWYPCNRVTRQMNVLLSNQADICGTSSVYFCETASEKAWVYRYGGGGTRSWVAGSTLAYSRAFWKRFPFPNLQIGEDTRFVGSNRQARIGDLNDPSLCVARIHPGNTCRKTPSGPWWQAVAIAEIRRVVGPAYDDFRSSTGINNAVDTIGRNLPLVSCIMPTANRADFVRLTLRSFQNQDYPRRELVIVDDGKEDITSLVEACAGVRYQRLLSRTSIGAKRNIACQAARGEIIAHWDDDDWYAPQRLSRQLAPLLKGDADLTGLECSRILDMAAGRFWRIAPELHEKMFVGNVHGGTLAFRKSIFDKGARYPEVNLAEDAAFIRLATRRGNRLVRVTEPDLFVYVRHGTNAWSFVPGEFLNSSGWHETVCPQAFVDRLPEYQACVKP